MKHVSGHIRIRRPVKDVWKVVGDVNRWHEFFVGATKWEPIGKASGAVGDRYHVLMGVGSIDAGGMIELTDVADNERVAFTSLTGIQFSGEFSLRPDGDNTDARMVFEINLRGGPPARVVEQLTGRIIRNNVIATLEALRHDVEFGAPAH